MRAVNKKPGSRSVRPPRQWRRIELQPTNAEELPRPASVRAEVQRKLDEKCSEHDAVGMAQPGASLRHQRRMGFTSTSTPERRITPVTARRKWG